MRTRLFRPQILEAAQMKKIKGYVSNPLNDTYVGRWFIRSLNRWLLACFLATNTWLLLFECEAVGLDGGKGSNENNL